MERYKRIKNRRTTLKAATTRQLGLIESCLNESPPNKAVFEEKRQSLQANLTSLRQVLKTMNDLIIDLEFNDDLTYDDTLNDLNENEIALEKKEEEAANLKQKFDTIFRSLKPSKTPNTVEETVVKHDKPKFKPKDLSVPKWDGGVINFKAWKSRIIEYFKLTGLDSDYEQLAILLYEPTLPTKIQSTLQDCVSVDSVWQRLDLKFPSDSIPRAILRDLKETKTMSSGSAHEMRRVLEKIKDFARHSKEANFSNDLNSHVTLDLVEQKLTDNLVREFRRWLHREHNADKATVELLINFLQAETELEERLANKCSTSRDHVKQRTTVNQIRSNSNVCCALCGFAFHKFIDCSKFKSLKPQERTDAMKRLGRCYTCLAAKHRDPRDCHFRRKCSLCEKSHHVMLACVPRNSRPAQRSPPLNPGAAVFQPSVSSVHTTGTEGMNFDLRYSPATYVELLGSDGVWHKAVALFDTGSDVTLVRKDMISKLNLERKPRKFKFGTAGGSYRTEDAAMVSLWVRRFDRKAYRYNMQAVELQKPAHDIPSMGKELFAKHPYLEPIRELIPSESLPVDILIGFDQASLMAPISYLRHPSLNENYPQAAECKLGYYIFGPAASASSCTEEIAHINLLRAEDPDIRQWYESDVCGVKPTQICVCKDKEIAESQFLKHVQNTIHQVEDGRVEVSLPWKDGFPSCLKFNRNQALSKLYSLERRLTKLNLTNTYCEEMNTVIAEFAEPVPDSEIIARSGWYLNHFPVLRPGKSTSCRIVWNSAAVYDGLALNDGLHKGPDLLNNLFCVLLAWRQNSIAMVGDIRKMFNQVQMAPPDRAYHRFLWRDGDSTKPPRDYQWKRLPFGDKPAPDLSISALHFLADKHVQEYPTASNIIKRHCYMDDIAFSVPVAKDTNELKKELALILSSGKFGVKGWHSNAIGVDEFSSDAVTDVLGLHWDKRLDCFQVKIPAFSLPEIVTKRTILSAIAKLWDPVGVLAPVTLRLRILLQSLWSINLGWDDPVSNDIICEFSKRMQEIGQLRTFWVNRCFQPTADANLVEVHGFCDGGEKGYGAVVWLRFPENEKITLTFLAAKTYVAALKKRSIPRIELMAAVVLTRLIATIRKVLPYSNINLWTDSAVVLHWLKQPATRFKPFVSTRVQEIKETLENDCSRFRYVKSALNPADALTKPIAISKLEEWHKGPEFLKDCNFKPDVSADPDLPDNIDIISRQEEKKAVSVCNVQCLKQTDDFATVLLERVSDWNKLLRVVAWLRRPLIDKNNRAATLSAHELNAARYSLFWLSQAPLREPQQQRLRQRMNLQPLDDDFDLLRIHGRLDNFARNERATKPIALPGGSKIVRLFARHLHRSLGHQGFRVVVVNLHAQGIYMLRGKQLLKSIAAKCIMCRTRRRELLQQQMGQLPTFRFKTNSPIFSSVSIDFFGPVKIKKTRNVVIDGAVLLITCTTTRVVHLELVETQSTHDFLLAWKRFISKRGVFPLNVFSDQAQCFVGAQNTLQTWVASMNQSEVNNFMTRQGTTFTWEFNVPKASHMNGIVESLVRSCRKAFDATTNYHKRSYSFLEWETIVAETNYLVNSRPLFPKAAGDLDEEPFTGNSLLYPHGQTPVPQNLSVDHFDPRKSIRIAHSFLKSFWEAWLRNMPPQLLLRSKWFKTRQNLREGDYVIVLEPGLHGQAAPRGLWEHAIVSKTLPGTDGLVRKVELRLSGQRKLTRPIHKLCLIATAEELEAGLES